MVVKTEATEIRRSASSGYRALVHIRETRRGSSAERRREAWLAGLKRVDLKPESYPYVRVCLDYFVNGVPSDLYDVNNPRLGSIAELGPAGMTFTLGEAAD